MSRAGFKRNAREAFTDSEMDSSKLQSPFLPMFEDFRAELDEHHDRRERVIKASRDITAASKKIIFALQRIRALNQPISSDIQKANHQYWGTINTQYGAISRDLQGINAYRYRSITGGNQEFIEALTFQHYLETQQLMTYQDAVSRLTSLGGEEGSITLTLDDYLLGVFDMVGELMRFSITAMATSGQLPTGEAQLDTNPQDHGISALGSRNVLTDLRELRSSLETLNVPRSEKFGKDVGKKMGVMRNCVEKVETATYGMIVRGSERPKGWLPDLNHDSAREEVEGY